MSTLVSRPEIASIRRMLPAQIRAELLKSWRVPAFTISSIGFPTMFYLLFGLQGPARPVAGTFVSTYLLASFAAYATISVMLFSFGVALASERAQRMHVLMRATPLRASVQIGARIVVAEIFAAIALLPLIAIGTVFGGVSLGPLSWAALIVGLLAGALPFTILGYAIGFMVNPNAAPAIVNVIFLPLSFASGLFIPLSELPEVVQKIAPYLPAYHVGKLAWIAVGAGGEILPSVLWLAGYGAAFAVLAVLANRREEQRAFG